MHFLTSLVHSETGSGKTAAFAFPILNKLFRDPRGIFSIILVPRREVALQICEQINFFGQQNNIRVVPVIGGVDYTTQKKKIESIPHIIVGTPGRLAEQLSKSKKARKYLRNLEFMVLDEADDLMNETLIDFVSSILQLIPQDAQLILSSATVAEEDLAQLRNLKLGQIEVEKKELVEVSLNNAVETARSITLRYCLQPAMLKDAYLLYLLEKYQGNDILVFFNKCE